MATEKEMLLEKWAEIRRSGGPGEFIRVDDSAVLPQYCGISVHGNYQFISISLAEPKSLNGTRVVRISESTRADGKLVQLFELLDENFLREFSTLCADLFSAARTTRDEPEALRRQSAAYVAWSKFFQPNQKMSLESARGLFAELTYLEMKMAPLYGFSVAIDSWKGPLGGHQDFVVEALAVEIKSIHRGATEVKISSEHQLDFPGNLTLRVYEVEEAAESSGESLSDIVSRIKSSLNYESSEKFMQLVLGVGFNFDEPLCTESRFVSHGWRDFDASPEAFPSIRAKSLQAGVSKVKYSLAISQIAAFEVSQ